MPAARPIPEAPSGAYCPHCGKLVQRGASAPWPEAPVRCPRCDLTIGVGRSRPAPSGNPGTKGAAAGVLSRKARRSDGPPGADRGQAIAAVRSVAKDLGTRPERLLMVDYAQYADANPRVPPLRDVLAHFKTWKAVRQAAAEHAGDGGSR